MQRLHSTTVFNIYNNNKKNILCNKSAYRMISEGSGDTEVIAFPSHE